MKSSLGLTSTTKFAKDELKKTKIILTSLSECNDSYDFREPVDWKNMGLTDYPTIIKYPMDLSTVAKKLKEEKYSKVQQILDDIQLIWDNCKAYNPPNSWIYSIAQKLQRSFKKMVKNYFSDLNILIPIKIVQPENKDARGPASLFDDDNEDITYHQKLKFSEQLSYLSSDQLEKVFDQIVAKCPNAYKDLGEGKGQILVDSMDMIFFNQISLMVRNLKELIDQNSRRMDVQQDKKTVKSGKSQLQKKIKQN